jgi:CubicO group peptidase (beta-lactamase class C family)
VALEPVARTLSLVCALALLASAPGVAQRRASTDALPPAWGEFTRAFDQYARGDSVVGGGAVIVRDGRILAHHEYGFADRAAGERIVESTIYHWASITKTLTAIAIMQLRDRGRLSLDDRIADYIPELRQVHSRFGPVDQITLRMLLSHSAGFQSPTWPYRSGKPWEPFEPTRWEQLVSMMPYQELEFKPGSQFGYSNPAFIYLARVIEQLTGDPYATYIQKNIWTPLGLTRSYFGATPYHLARWRSNNYTVQRDSSGREAVVANGRDFDPGITIPNSGWNAPLGDLAAYASFLTYATRNDTGLARIYHTVLKQSTLKEMWQSVVRVPRSEDLGDAVGLSFFLFPSEGTPVVGHTGEQAGFRSFLYVNPQSRMAIIGALNTLNEAHPEQSAAGWARLTKQAREAVSSQQ